MIANYILVKDTGMFEVIHQFVETLESSIFYVALFLGPVFWPITAHKLLV